MPIEIVEHPLSELATYAAVSPAYRVERILELVERGDSLSLDEAAVETPYVKDYDTLGSPLEWPKQFDLAAWGLLGALVDGRHVGGAAIAFDTPDLAMLKGRRDVAVLWDLRVDPTVRRRGIGGALFRAAEDWAASRGCTEFVVETQNTNIPACGLYENLGCHLLEVNPGVYPASPEEVQLIWSKRPRAL